MSARVPLNSAAVMSCVHACPNVMTRRDVPSRVSLPRSVQLAQPRQRGLGVESIEPVECVAPQPVDPCRVGQ